MRQKIMANEVDIMNHKDKKQEFMEQYQVKPWGADSDLCACCCGYGFADESGNICECCDGEGIEIQEDQ